MLKTFLNLKKKGERLFLSWRRAHVLIRIRTPLTQQYAHGSALIFSITALVPALTQDDCANLARGRGKEPSSQC